MRQELERFHRERSETGLNLALRHIDDPDRHLAFAARVALENQAPEKWTYNILERSSPNGLLALARVGDAPVDAAIVDALGSLTGTKQGQVDDSTLLTLLRALQLSYIRQGEPDTKTRQLAISTLLPLYPSDTMELNHELGELLVYLKTPGVIEPTLKLMEASTDTRDWSHYLTLLRFVDEGWSTDLRRRYFLCLRNFETFPGGRDYVRTAQDLRGAAVAILGEEEKEALADLLDPVAPESLAPPITIDPVVFVKDWTIDDFTGDLRTPLEKRPTENGSRIYHEIACAACHRFGADPSTTHAILGPDLSGIGSRFDARAILESIISPSLVISDAYRNPSGPNISLMPPGLINGLEKEEVLDLVAYLLQESRSNPLN